MNIADNFTGLNIKPPDEVIKVIKLLEASGKQAVLVGGCVRDSLRGKTPPDWDIATNALPEETERIFLGSLRVIKTGIKHGTITAVSGGRLVEVTTFRRDGDYLDCRHPENVAFGVSLIEDLNRRDFTMNAIAYSSSAGLIDPLGGCEDLKNGLIKSVGDPNARFLEDALRILRAIRFVSQHSFAVEPSTERAMRENAGRLLGISAERVSSEISGILTGGGVGTALRSYHDILSVVIPEIIPMVGFNQRNPYHKYDVFEHTVRVVENTPPDFTLRLAALFHDIGKPAVFTIDDMGVGHFYRHPAKSMSIAAEVMARLKMKRRLIERVTKLVEHHDRYIEPSVVSMRRAVSKFGAKTVDELIKLKRADCIGQGTHIERLYEIDKLYELLRRVIDEDSCLSLKGLKINGNDIIALGVAPGKHIGIILNELLKMVLDERVKNEPHALIRQTKKLLKNPRLFL